MCIKLNQIYLNCFYNKGITLNIINNNEEAIHPNYKDAYYNKGIALHNINKYEEAIQAYDMVIKLDVNQLNAYIYRGVTLFNQNKYEEPREFYKIAIKVNPFYTDLYSDKEKINYEVIKKLENSKIQNFNLNNEIKLLIEKLFYFETEKIEFTKRIQSYDSIFTKIKIEKDLRKMSNFKI